jgi:diguanylate cyclase (GGDEF)-like protein
MRAEELRQKIQVLESEELQVQGLALLMVLAVGGALVLALIPQVRANLGITWGQAWFLPLTCALSVTASVFFGLYAHKKLRLNYDARRGLARQMGAEDLSLIDPLTGLLNRHYLDKNFSKEIGWAERLGVSLTLVMLVAHNSRRWGRSTGNRVLAEVADLLKRNFRGSDTLVRYGGNEFVVLMLGTNEQKAHLAMERLQEMATHGDSEQSQREDQLAFSYGTAAHAKGVTIAELLQAASQKLYQHQARLRAAG